MKIIIVGCGKVGLTLTEQLNNEGHDITVIDKDGAKLRSVTDNIDVMGVEGNGAIYQVQMEAGIKETDLLIATTNSDELNMPVTATPLRESVIRSTRTKYSISGRS